MTDAITIQNVRKTFGPKVAVDDISLNITSGLLYGLIGPNGAGKTTTIRMVMSIIFPDSGKISVLGKASAVESKDRIGYLPEERGIYRKMRVGAFLTYMARLKGVDSAGLDRKVREWLARVGLADCYRKKCEELSKGMQQKVQFVSSVIHDPDLIILDEPFSGLDPVNSRLMRSLIHELHKSGKTIIFSTHVMAHAEQICDHIVMINRGKKVLDAPLAEIYGRFDPRTILLEPLDPAADISVIGSMPGVQRVRPVRGAAGTEVVLDERADKAAVMRSIVDALAVRRIELRRANLEDIFIGIVVGSGGTGGEDGLDETQLRGMLREEHAAHAGAQS